MANRREFIAAAGTATLGARLAVHPRARPAPLLDPAVGAMTFSGSERELAERLAGLVAGGLTEFVYSPAGPDIPRELRAMARVARAAGFPGVSGGPGRA